MSAAGRGIGNDSAQRRVAGGLGGRQPDHASDCLLTFPYSVGATTILGAGRPSPDAIFANIQRFRPTILFSVPTLYNAVLNAPGAETQDLSSVRICASAAEPLPAEIWERWNRTFGVAIIDGIGSTEMAHIYCSNSEGATKPGSSGRPVPGYSLQILDEEGNEGRGLYRVRLKGVNELVYIGVATGYVPKPVESTYLSGHRVAHNRKPEDVGWFRHLQ